MSWLYEKVQKYREAIMYSAIPAVFAIATIGALSGKNEPIMPKAPLEERVAKTEKKSVRDLLLESPPKDIDMKALAKLYNHSNGNIALLTAGRNSFRLWSEYIPLTSDDEKAMKRLIDLHSSGSSTQRHILENGEEIAHYMINDKGRIFFIHDYQNKTAYYPLKQKKQVKSSNTNPRKQ